MTTNNVNVIEITEAIATINTNVEGTIKFNAKWDLFIVPNQAVPMIDDFMSVGYATKQLNRISSLLRYNNIDEFTAFGMNEKLVQVWYTNDKCENGVRHDPYVLDQDGHDWDIKFDMGEYLPVCILKRFHEGETHVVNIPVILTRRDPVTHQKIIRDGCMMCDLTAKQKHYRYASHGNFEEALKRVLQ